jgi:prepilin-type N-terminal cleavage/methylation domain-containing protein
MKLPFTIYDLRFTICRKSVGFSAFNHQSSIVDHKFRRGFTLIEMLVVLSIMAIIAALAVPALKNFGHADAMTAADQQMLNDVARARQLAISQHTTVYMVFVPANFWYGYYGTFPNAWWNSLTSAQSNAVANLCGNQLAGYTFMSYGGVGDQPGRHQWHYLAPWQTLPDGTFIPTNKFGVPGTAISSSFSPPAPPLFYQWNRDYPHPDQNTIYAFTNMPVPIPTEGSPNLPMPYIAFNYLGQLTFDGQTLATRHEYIPLARGSVLPAVDANTKMFLVTNTPAGAPQVYEVPPGNSTNAYNLINIDPLTGRARLEEPRVR